MKKKLFEEYADKGRLIEAGWQIIRQLALPDDMPAGRINECRFLFFLGAQHLWTSIFEMLSPGVDSEPIDEDRMNKINEELREFAKEILDLRMM